MASTYCSSERRKEEKKREWAISSSFFCHLKGVMLLQTTMDLQLLYCEGGTTGNLSLQLTRENCAFLAPEQFGLRHEKKEEKNTDGIDGEHIWDGHGKKLQLGFVTGLDSHQSREKGVLTWLILYLRQVCSVLPRAQFLIFLLLFFPPFLVLLWSFSLFVSYYYYCYSVYT